MLIYPDLLQASASTDVLNLVTVHVPGTGTRTEARSSASTYVLRVRIEFTGNFEKHLFLKMYS